jgi:hypothetical protein
MGLLPTSQEQQKKLLIGLVPLLAAFAYYQFVHMPKSVEIELLDEQLMTLETTNNAARIRGFRGLRRRRRRRRCG